MMKGLKASADSIRNKTQGYAEVGMDDVNQGVSNLTDDWNTLQAVLRDTGIDNENGTDNEESDEEDNKKKKEEKPALISGYLFILVNGNHWQKLYCEYKENRTLFFRGQTTNAAGVQESQEGSITVSFIDNEPSPSERMTIEQARSVSESKYDTKYNDLFWAYLESSYLSDKEAHFAFKIFTPTRMHFFAAETDSIREKWLDVMRNHLKKNITTSLYDAKVTAAEACSNVYRRQFVEEITRYDTAMVNLANNGFKDVLPSTLHYKNKRFVFHLFFHRCSFSSLFS